MSDHGFAYIFTIINFLKFNIPIFTSVLVFLSHEIREIIYFCLPFLLFNSVYAVNIILSKTSFLIRCLRKFSCLILILVISFHVVRIFLQTSPLLTYSMPSIFYIRCWMHMSVALGHFFINEEIIDCLLPCRRFDMTWQNFPLRNIPVF